MNDMPGDLGAKLDKASRKDFWQARLARTGGDDPVVLPIFSNVQIILSNDPLVKGLLAFNEFTSDTVITRSPPVSDEHEEPMPGPYPRPWGQEDVLCLLGYVQRTWSRKFARQTIEEGMLWSAFANRFHPVRDWLAGLVWDGVPRLDNWIVNAFDCDPTPLNKAIGAKFLIAAVRRIKVPGCKFDHMLILEGPQGLGKSTAAKVLFGSDCFSDDIPPDLSDKDAAIALTGVWCLEFAEIAHLIKQEAEVIKAFISRPVDRYRPPYGKTYISKPRQGVLLGTTNLTSYLSDATGNRRIWPVACRTADAAWIAMHRDQIWAEAVVRERTGEAIWLEDDALRAEVTEHQAIRMISDVWDDKVQEWLRGKQKVRTAEILGDALQVPIDRMTRAHEMRIGSIMHTLGWRKLVSKVGTKSVRYWVIDEKIAEVEADPAEVEANDELDF